MTNKIMYLKCILKVVNSLDIIINYSLNINIHIDDVLKL